jgi:hypothetical protein
MDQLLCKVSSVIKIIKVEVTQTELEKTVEGNFTQQVLKQKACIMTEQVV